MLSLVTNGEAVDLGFGLLDRNARAKAAYNQQKVSIVALLVFGRDVSEKWHPNIYRSIRERKTTRHHAHNFAVLSIQANLLMDNIKRASEAPLPKVIADDCDAWCTSTVFVRPESAA